MIKQFHVIGVMSGTSLDGIDFAEILFTLINNKWSFELKKCDTYSYSYEWSTKLKTAFTYNKDQLTILNNEYTKYLSNNISKFIVDNSITNIDAVCSHGHTILHQPHKGITLQIGNLPELATYIQQKVICNFRVQDVDLGGQGAPLVPVGDLLLFHKYDFCINLGGFANVSFQNNNNRIAYDNCAVNVILNHFAEKTGMPYDKNGEIARNGSLNQSLLKTLNAIPYYQKSAPKSLGMEWVDTTIFPIIKKYAIPIQDILHTYVIHIAQIISKNIAAHSEKNILITGGGAYNTFLIEQLKKHINAKITVPKPKLIEYKEALIFGLLGVLRINNKTNVLSSVTGASKNHSAGQIFDYIP